MAKNYLESMLGENERIVLITRQHWFVLFSSILAEVIVTLIVITAISFLTVISLNPLAAFGFLLILIPLAIMLRDILVWYNREYIVTNRRVIQIFGVFNKSVTDSSLEKVNDVKMIQSFFGRLFDYGDVEILTGSELGVNLFRRIGDPVKFKTAMLNAKEKLGYEGTGGHAQTQAAHELPTNIPAMIVELAELRKQGIITEAEFQQKKKELLSKM